MIKISFGFAREPLGDQLKKQGLTMDSRDLCRCTRLLDAFSVLTLNLLVNVSEREHIRERIREEIERDVKPLKEME